ncbi:hypothetical protein [Bacillus velezensis]|uniref:hypothetical protein n=1 Tax=Bacillus velezensis TaxID=492670 RepID=UPI00119D176D|nr:hypothetical protein [Bacillus velezensis]
MQDKKEDMYSRELIQKSEIKRIGENVTKKELTDMLDINYMYYLNCIRGDNKPSKRLIASLDRYLSMPTSVVYETIFARRVKEGSDKRLKRDENGKEIYHHSLGVSREMEQEFLKELEEKGVFKAPEEADE